jgi:Holliday junction DNA helicase RuvA
MYGYIIGTITKITPKYIIIENNGIGYIVIVPNPYNYKLDTIYTIYLYQHVKEDAIELYGFLSWEEHDLFLKLITVSGIGPKSALSILASATVSEVYRAIEARDDKYLKKFPGIGPKAAQQIILDLKGKLAEPEVLVNRLDSKLNDVVDALMALGYSKKEVTGILAKLDNTKDVSTLVKEALRLLVK